MNSEFLADMERFALLTFTRQKLCQPVLEEIHRLLLLPLSADQRHHLNTVRRWLLCPYTLWPVDFKGLSEKMCRDLVELKDISDEMTVILNRLENLPTDETQDLIGKNERAVKSGDYNDYLTPTAQGKFEDREAVLLQDKEFEADLKDLERRFDLKKHYLPGKLLRRTLACERNIRPEGFETQFATEEERFKVALDSICAKFHLYGILDRKPLLLKLSVNPTPHGLMIFVPAYWSLDYKRDLNWPKIMELQKLRSSRANEIEYQNKLKRVAAAMALATERGITGEEKLIFICEELGVSIDTDEGTLRRWMRDAKKLVN